MKSIITAAVILFCSVSFADDTLMYRAFAKGGNEAVVLEYNTVNQLYLDAEQRHLLLLPVINAIQDPFKKMQATNYHTFARDSLNGSYVLLRNNTTHPHYTQINYEKCQADFNFFFLGGDVLHTLGDNVGAKQSYLSAVGRTTMCRSILSEVYMRNYTAHFYINEVFRLAGSN